MKQKLHIDIETYSSVDISSSGAYKYTESVDFEILLIAWALGDRPVQIIDLASGEKMDKDFIYLLTDPTIEKHAHNATFERQAFKQIGFDIPIDQWHCSAVKSAYMGLPLALADVSEALRLGDKSKLTTGKALIRFFSCPVKPTKINGQRTRNLPHHHPEKWEQFKHYCTMDVVAEREIISRLSKYEIPDFERRAYIQDQKINDKGVLIDLDLSKKAKRLSNIYKDEMLKRTAAVTGLDNPNSPAQLKSWLSVRMGREVESLNKDILPQLIDETDDLEVKEVIELRQKIAKTSIKKYDAMIACASDHDGRARGLFQFYGASRTGRWAGRLIQLQNLPRNYIEPIEQARDAVVKNDYKLLSSDYEDPQDIISQLVRTALIAPSDKSFAVADFSAIEARVIAWLVDEEWRLDVFKSGTDLYKASIAKMLSIDVEDVTPDLRAKGKVAELALGYSGGVGALKAMGGEDIGLSEEEMQDLTNVWRQASPKIVRFWKGLNALAIRAVKTKRKVKSEFKGLLFACDGWSLTVTLPSGRHICYVEPDIGISKFGQECFTYMGNNQKTKKWERMDTFGGKLAENITQAIARDLLVHAMSKVGSGIVIHVHDEVAVEGGDLDKICELMSEPPEWALDLPLGAEGFISKFYKK